MRASAYGRLEVFKSWSRKISTLNLQRGPEVYSGPRYLSGHKSLSLLVADSIIGDDGSAVRRFGISDFAAQDAIFGDTEATVAGAGKGR